MRHSRVVVMGAGVAGMAAALLLARDGHSVTIVERDHFAVGTLDEAIDWKRKGVPHFIQPHAFIPRGRVELKQHLPDVYDDLVKAGAETSTSVRRFQGLAFRPTWTCRTSRYAAPSSNGL